MAKQFVRFKARGAFTALVRKLPAEYQAAFMSLLESIMFRNEMDDYTSSTGDLVSHSTLTGLDSDDHPQYYNDDRINTWLGTKDITDLDTYDHTSLTTIGSNTHAQIDTHLDSDTGHPNIVVYASEPADGTIGINEGAFWYEPV